MNRIISYCRSHSDLLVFITLLIGSGVFSQLISKDYAVAGERPQIVLTAKLLLGFSSMLSAWMIIVFWDNVKQKFTLISGLWFLLLIWALVSILLGQFNTHSLVRLAGFIGCTLVGVMLYISTQRVRDVILSLFWVCTFIVILNFAYIDWPVLSSLSSKNVDGIFFQKNILGHFAFMAMFVSAFVFAKEEVRVKWFAGVVFLAAAWLLYLSTSMTSNLLIIVAILSVISSLIISSYKKGWLVVAASILVLISLLAFNWTEFFSLIGKNSTFTSRTSIWAEYWSLIEQRFFIGHGYGAYPEKLTYLLKFEFHSGYIAVMYYLGAIGFSMLAIIIGMSMRSWWKIVRERSLAYEACFLISFLAVLLTLNITEPYFLNRSGLAWPLFVYSSLQLFWLSKVER